MRASPLLTVFVLGSGVLFAQADGNEPDKPKFDIADVHPSPRPTSGFVRFATGGIVRGGRYDLHNATMLDLIRMAYDVDPATIQGGPNWLEMDRFNIAAKAPQSTSSTNVKLMLQSLLAERFKLVVHNGTMNMPAYILKVGAKTKLKEASAGGAAGCQFVPQKNEPGTALPILITCHSESMEEFAKFLRGFQPDPLVDSTGLKGEWDFDLKWYNRNQLALFGAGAITLFDALDQQLGLKLDLGATPAPVLFVDSVNETPTPNAPGVAQALPPEPQEFEVADIKMTPPDEPTTGASPYPGGRVQIRGLTLRQIMQLAWHMLPDMIIGATKSVENTKYDITAKTSSVMTATQFDEDDIQAMERTLLADRFKLKTHLEERPYPAYTLLAVKPKLTKADPSNRTGCKEAPAMAKDPRDTDPARSRLVTCLNITMAEFADQLQRFSGGYINTPVLDATGIQGRYDITLSFSTAYFIQMSQRSGLPANGAQGGGAPTAADPSGGLSLFDAISKQLGLKLELQKRPIPMLVIDSVAEKPTDN